MFLNNTNYYQIGQSYYLLIQKNGCSTVLENFDYQIILDDSPEFHMEYPRWTVIREPYERFVSGLAYDLKRLKRHLKEQQIETYINKNSEKLFFGKFNEYQMQHGGWVSHTYPQSFYLFNKKIDHYVNIEDLNLFINIHNKNYKPSGENKTNKEDKEFAMHMIDLFFPKKDLEKYLYVDKKMYEMIQNDGKLWRWQHGQILLW